MEEDEFVKQLEEEKLAKLKEEGKETYTDEDGTVYEWDMEKKAWFPKIDEDFIANYQMNYGQNETTTKATVHSSQPQEYDKEAYEKYCKDYYAYYGYTYNPETNSIDKKDNTESMNDETKPNINPDTGEPFKDYAEYYAYYYGEEYAEYYKNFQEDQLSTPGANINQQPKKQTKKELKKQQAGEKRKLPPEKEEPKWFEYEAEHGKHVYVTGLPPDTTEEEFTELMNKYGLIMFDPFTKKPKIKLYKDRDGNVKGDGLCCYIKKESVDLVLNLLEGYDIRGSKLTVERAKFEMKGDFDPTKKKKKLSNKQKRKLKEKQEKLFEWKLDKVEGVRLKHEKIVVLKNMFDAKEFEKDPTLINELREEVRTECLKYGDVKKVVLYDRNPEGVMTIAFKTAEEGDVCIEALHGRWFGGKQIAAEAWDGQTKYEIEETEEEKQKRLESWDKFLEDGTAPNTTVETSPVAPSGSGGTSQAISDRRDETSQADAGSSGETSQPGGSETSQAFNLASSEVSQSVGDETSQNKDEHNLSSIESNAASSLDMDTDMPQYPDSKSGASSGISSYLSDTSHSTAPTEESQDNDITNDNQVTSTTDIVS